MGQSLGTIFVDLQANTGGFVSALSKAAATAQAASKQISREFSDLGRIASQTFGAFGNFNPVISKLSFVLSSAGSAASSAMKSFSGMGGALGPLAALGAGAAVGIAAAGLAVAGIAIHSAESAAKLLELSRSTGVSVEALSGLQFAAKQTGLEQEQLVKSLQLLASNMVKAASAPAGAATAFSRLGLNIRQQNGDLKDAGKFMTEVISKLAEMRDKTAAVGEARQMMGRGGAAMLQLGDPKEIEHWIDMAQKLGVVIDGQTAAAALRFEQTLGLLKAAAEGASNRLMAAMLPALTAVAEAFAGLAEDSGKAGQSFSWIGFVGESIKTIIGVMNTWWHGMQQVAEVLVLIAELIGSTFEAIGHAIFATKDLFTFDFSGAKKELQDGLGAYRDTIKGFITDTKRNWNENTKFLNALTAKPATGPLPPTGQGKSGLGTGAAVPTASGRPDVIAELIAKLQAQATAELALATATDKSTAAILLAKAAAEAEQKITETRSHLFQEELALIDRLADAKAKAAAGEKGGGQEALKIEAEIKGLQRFVEELEKNSPRIRALYAEIAAGGFGAKAADDIQKFIDKTDEETAALQRMTAAYRQGPEAVQRAEIEAKIAPLEDKRKDVGEVITGLKAAGAPDEELAKYQTIFNQLTTQIDEARASETKRVSSEISERIAKETLQLSAEAAAYNVVANAAFKSAEAQREAAAQAAAIKFGVQALHVAPEELQKAIATPEDQRTEIQTNLVTVYQNELAVQKQRRDETIAQTAAQLDLNTSYAQEIEKLQEVRSVLVSMGESTLSVDAKIYEANLRRIETWNREANVIGSVADKFRAMVNEIEIQGEGFGAKVFGSFAKAIDDVSGQLAKLVVTGKSNFRELFASLEEELLKATLQKGFSVILGKVFAGSQPAAAGGAPSPFGRPEFGPNEIGPGGTAPFAQAAKPAGALGFVASIFGLGGGAGLKRDGSSPGSALYVIPAGAAAGLGGNSSSKGSVFDILPGSIPNSGSDSGGGDNGFGSILSNISSSITGPLNSAFASVGNALGGLGGVFGKLLSGIGGIFGGFLAGGGDVSPGKAYVVGERRPELFVPNQAGRIIPSISQASGNGGNVHHTEVHMHINGVTDADSFQRSQNQLYGDALRAMTIAHSRTR